MPDAPVGRVRVRVPAKVNLLLSVGDVRPDGYHDLATVFHAVDLYDEVTAVAADSLSLTVAGADVDGVPDDGRNLAWQAAELLAAHAGVTPGVRLHLDKAIPVAGGMAGGSADAAATLVACARLWGLDVTTDDLLALAARLGSDVAFPLLGGTALGTGRGELLRPVVTAAPLHWVFALADHGLSTAAAYGGLDELRASGRAPAPVPDPSLLITALGGGDLAAVAAALGNDLQAASLELAPALARTLAAGTALGALAGLVSGSGPTCAFLCDSAASAAALATALEAEGVCRRARVACGPVGGAAVVDEPVS